MSWEILVGLLGLIGMLIPIYTLIVNNTRAMTKITCAIEELKKAVNEQKKMLEKEEHRIANHETRITVLEQHKKEI